MPERLNVVATLDGMANALPKQKLGDDLADLASPYEAISLLIHSYMKALGFTLTGSDQDMELSEAESLAPRLPLQWKSSFGSLAFTYTHKQSSMSFVIHVDRTGSKVEVRGLAVGDENGYRFERTLRDVVLPSGLPVRITMKDNTEDRNILRDLDDKIIQKLISKLQGVAYVETADPEAEATVPSERRAQEARDRSHLFRGDPVPGPDMKCLAANPLPEISRPSPHSMSEFPPPGFEDEYEMNRPPQGARSVSGRSTFNMGHDDLNSPGLGPHDPLRVSSVGGGLPRLGGGSGMHPTLDDPLFSGSGQGESGGYDPQASPGARRDPVGPGSNPRFPGPGSGRDNAPSEAVVLEADNRQMLYLEFKSKMKILPEAASAALDLRTMTMGFLHRAYGKAADSVEVSGIYPT
ncbi:hypothetical protein MRS44_017591 [Fusarium solani]|uniref:uncharacterized protein n=1 Tax=Fusarium solani TaxID=169388 RepID=UPI0032C3E7C1|nr:hypothetical protein MRS44_017591 [Fusarium solani]